MLVNFGIYGNVIIYRKKEMQQLFRLLLMWFPSYSKKPFFLAHLEKGEFGPQAKPIGRSQAFSEMKHPLLGVQFWRTYFGEFLQAKPFQFYKPSLFEKTVDFLNWPDMQKYTPKIVSLFSVN